MNYKQIITYFGSVKDAADKLGVSRQAVWLWRTRPIPYHRQVHIEQISVGTLKARRNGKR